MNNILAVLCAILFSTSAVAKEKVAVGSKKFTESYILAEIFSQLLEENGFEVDRKFGFGGTLIAYTALVNNEVQVYPEYTGTISQAILKNTKLKSRQQITEALKTKQLNMLPSLGFNNTYAIAVNKNFASEHKLEKISDLKQIEVQAALGYEFIDREDGWQKLKEAYQLNNVIVKGIEHELAYNALAQGSADIMEAYSTDAKILEFDLVLLKDDLNFFPQYLAVPLANASLDQRAIQTLQLLDSKIDEKTMIELNAFVQRDGKTFAEAAQKFLVESGLKKANAPTKTKSEMADLLSKIYEHLYLTFVAILMAVLFALPTAILLQGFKKTAEVVMALAGLMQTIPSIALLAFMIPLFGIGTKPAIIGLFLYSILPILRNAYVGLHNIESHYLESAKGIGLTRLETLFLIQLPMGLPVIISGIRTAAVINIGTATLAAFIGAGGLGEYIVTGLSLNDTDLILKGAIPSAILALMVEIIFTFIENKTKIK